MTEFRVISIGTLSAHPLWNESVAVRTGHATTTLVESKHVKVIVNPSLPAAIVGARLEERSPVKQEDVTHVFLTSFDLDHRRGLEAFEHATWLVHEPEAEYARQMIEARLEEARGGGDEELTLYFETELDTLRRCRIADDSITPGIDLFPAPGATVGTCALLLPQPRQTVLIAGDAVATVEHLEKGQVLPRCENVEEAMESFKECVEIADVIVPGRDNVTYNPARSIML